MGPVVKRIIVIEFEIRHVAQTKPAGQRNLNKTQRTLEALLDGLYFFGPRPE